MKQCNHCGASLDDDALFCYSCGTKYEAPQGRLCPKCGAAIDPDSLFCAACGSRIDIPSAQTSPTPQPSGQTAEPTTETISQPSEAGQTAIQTNTEPTVSITGNASTDRPNPSPSNTEQVSETNSNGSKNNKTILIVTIVALLLVMGGIGGYWYYENVYIPEKTDREAPRYYTFASSVVLRSSKQVGVDYNKVASLPYGTELITYEYTSEWSNVKTTSFGVDGQQHQGYVASPYLLDKKDFMWLNSIFGNPESLDCIQPSKYRLALLTHFKTNQWIGYIDEQERIQAGIDIVPNTYNQWQVFCRPAEMTPNNVLLKQFSRDAQYQDLFVIVKNINTSERKLIHLCFDSDDILINVEEEDAPSEGYLKDAIKTRSGEIRYIYSF